MNQFDELLSNIRRCQLCVETPTFKPLPHSPRPIIQAATSARILIAGQAPGIRVHASGQPFTDPSGDRLRDWMGIDELVFYDPTKLAIVPMGFCFPGHNAKRSDLPPRAECAPAWREQVMAQLSDLALVLVIGQYAQKWHLGATRKASLDETVRHWRSYYDAALPCLPLPHPSWRNNGWLKRNPWFGEEILPVLRRDVQRLTG